MIKDAWRITKLVFQRTILSDRLTSLAASMSFFAILSFIPFMLLATSLLGSLLASSETTMQELLEFISLNFPGSTATAFEVFNSTIAGSKVYGLIGFVGLAWAGMKVFDIMEYTINRIWRGRGKRNYFHSKLVAAICIPIMIAFVVVSIVLTAILHSLLQGQLPFLAFSIIEIPVIGTLVAYLAPLPVSTLLFTWLFYLLPNRVGHLRCAFYGALLSAVLWEIAKVLFDSYVKQFGPQTNIYGSFTSVALLFLWVYYSSIVVIVGAEFGSVLQQTRERRLLQGAN